MKGEDTFSLFNTREGYINPSMAMTRDSPEGIPKENISSSHFHLRSNMISLNFQNTLSFVE